MTDPLDDVGSTTRRSDLAPAAAPASPADDGATVTRASLRERSPSGGRAPDRSSRARRAAASAGGVADAGDVAARHPGRTRARARARRSGDTRTRTTTLPRVQVPTALTQTGARILVLTGSRIRPIAESTRPVWHPVLEVLRWVSPLGWTVLGVGLVSWWLTARYAWVELAMVAVACLVLVLACLALAVGRARVRIRVDVEPTRVTVGDPATGRIEVTNASRRGLLPLLVELPVGDTAARFALPSLGAGRAHEELFVVPTRRRGVVPVGPAPRCTATRSGWCGAPWRGPSAPSCSSTRSPSRSRAWGPGCCATSRAR